MDIQFYPTPPALAKRAWAKFKNRDFRRVLEPHGGEGHLAEANPWAESYHHHRKATIDCCEIDVTKHAILRSKGLNVVGIDFMNYASGTLYSHVIMNGPFAEGAKHLLKAWELLWDGEIVAIINAETINNPYTRERQMLARLIEQHGEVEIIEGAFAVEEAERKTLVDVALVYLCKKADVGADIVGDLLGELRGDSAAAENLAREFQESHEMTLPNSFVENAVLAFNAAVKAMRDSVFAEARSNYYTALLGDTMAVRNGDVGDVSRAASVGFVQNEVGKRYLDLKDRSWSGILRSSNVTSRLSSAAQRRVEHEFDDIKKLEFTVVNIYGFLCGIAESRGQIQIEMACDVFDIITRYHSDNAVFYKGWKSNDKHRTCGMRIKTSRFVLPGHGTDSWRSSISWDSQQLLRDFDKVFAMLDGKVEPEVGLAYIFDKHLGDLKAGERVSSSYYDCRYYPGAGTIHFYARRRDLVERLNRLVGQHRRWLPPEGSRVSDAFWLQYNDAETFDKEVRAEANKKAKNRWNHPLHAITSSNAENRAEAEVAMDEAITTVLVRHGINVDFRVEEQRQEQLLLAAA